MTAADCLLDNTGKWALSRAKCSILIFQGVVTEYRAQILEDDNGNRFVATFPEGVTKAVQYGTGLKAHSVYMSQFQLVPYNRVQDHFSDQLHIPVSEGSIFNFNKEAFELLAEFENRVKNKLAASDLAHADETGINIGGKGHWLHCVSNDFWTLYYPHAAVVSTPAWSRRGRPVCRHARRPHARADRRGVNPGTIALALFLAWWMALGLLETRADGTLSRVLGWPEWPFYAPGVLSLLLWAAVAACQLGEAARDGSA